MALTNPGLADQLAIAVEHVRQLELAAGDNTVEGTQGKAVASGHLLLLSSHLERPDGTNALDYDDEGRTEPEGFYKSQVVHLLDHLLELLQADPARNWPEVADLNEILDDLVSTEDLGSYPEIIKLSGQTGITVACTTTDAGVAEFYTPAGTMAAMVYKARTSDVMLNCANVYLIEQLPAPGEEEPTGRYALMADDSYWGRRIQPASFVQAPASEDIVVGYRLKGQVLDSGTPVPNGNVSLELTLATAEHGNVTAWDSLEYNELVYDSQLDTYVAGAQVFAPIRTGADGRWEFIAPKGHGAYYQRQDDLRDDSPETAARGLARHLERVRFAYKGRLAEVAEGTEAVLNILSGTLAITAEPGTSLLVGTLDNPGQPYTVGAGGVVTISGLPQAEHSIVAFKLTPWGAWDQSWGCPRVTVEVLRGETSSLTMPPMEQYTDPNVICGRAYERPGVPAAGIDIVAVDPESCEVVGVIATTDDEGFWSVIIPPEGLGGEPAVHDPKWGSVPVLGMPYSDVVLGARAYAAHYEMYKPEAWRRAERGHANFQFCLGSVEVRTPDDEIIATGPTDYGGWLTTETLPKHRYIEDIEEFVQTGAQTRLYDLLLDGEAVISDFELRSQPFEGQDTAPGHLRAAGYYPEVKLLLGGKIHGNVLKGDSQQVKGNLPEAARVGLEFGEHEHYVEARSLQTGSGTRSCLADLVCPYCGGPAYRDPSGAYLRGYCMQCANAFQRADAMDCRGYFETPTLEGGEETAYHLWLVQLAEGIGCWARGAKYHWRPDLYEESDDFLTQNGPAQITNAPRWVARHVNEMDDGNGFGRFDGDQTPQFISGHDLDYYQGLTEIEHEMVATQLKLVFATGHVTPLTYTVDVDCKRLDDGVDTVRLTIPAGSKGPDGADEFGDVIRLVETPKLVAESKEAPYRGAGLYKGVADIRLVEPASALGCRFTVVNDVPMLCSAEGVEVESQRATPVALHVVGAWGSPHVMDDAVGQLMMFWANRGDIHMAKRAGLPGDWTDARRITEGGDADEPWAGKDAVGCLTLVCSRGGHRAQVLKSHDDGFQWEEV